MFEDGSCLIKFDSGEREEIAEENIKLVEETDVDSDEVQLPARSAGPPAAAGKVGPPAAAAGSRGSWASSGGRWRGSQSAPACRTPSWSSA